MDFVPDTTSPSPVVPVSAAPVGPVGSVSSGWDPLCVSNAMGEGLDPGVTCGVPVVPVAPGVGPVVPVVGEPSVVTVGMVWSAVREVPVPAAVLVVAPPGGETLVNLETVFSTEVGEFETSVVLLGQRVRLVLSPVWFRWVAGDGVSWVTSGPGVGYSPGLPMGGYVSHRYVRAGVVSARVDVGWAARFSVAGGPWQEVAGRVVVVGVPVELRVREAAPRLVG